MDIFINREFDKYYAHSPIVHLDIGASGGLQKNWRGARRHLIKIFVEPDEHTFNNLSKNADEGTILISTPLYSERKFIDFYICRKQEVSSIYFPNREFLNQFPDPQRFDVIDTTKLEADTLDNVLKKYNTPDKKYVIDFIKVDTQGSELDIIRGATETIKNGVMGLEVEVEFAEIYKGQHFFEDVNTFLREHGFVFFDFTQTTHWRKKKFFGSGQLVSADALYFKKLDLFINEMNRLPILTKKIGVLKYMSLCHLYKNFDHANTLFRTFSDLFTEREERAINLLYQKHYLISLARNPSRFLKTPGKIYKLFRNLKNNES